jgi:hypothetical protein
MGRPIPSPVLHPAPSNYAHSSQESISHLRPISDFALSSTNIERQTGSSHALSLVRNNEKHPASLHKLVLRTRLVAAHLLRVLERLLAAPLSADAASRHSLFGGSSSPSRPPLLSFPTRLACTVLRYHGPFTALTNIRDSRYSLFAIL